MSHDWNIRQESIDPLRFNLGCLSWAVLQSFVPVRAPKGKHEQQGHVPSRAVFVATDGLPANVYMANTMKWKGAKEAQSENIVAGEKFPLCAAMIDPEATDLTLDILSTAIKNVFCLLCVTMGSFPKLFSAVETFWNRKKGKSILSLECLSGRIFTFAINASKTYDFPFKVYSKLVLDTKMFHW